MIIPVRWKIRYRGRDACKRLDSLDSWIVIQIRFNTVKEANRCVIGKTAEDRRPVLQWIYGVHPSNMTFISARKQAQPIPTDRYVQTRPKATQQKVLRIVKRIYKRTLPAALDVSVLLGRTIHLEA